MTDDLPEEIQRWTAKRRAALIVNIIRGETSVQEAARKHGLTVAEVEDWKEKYLGAPENALRTQPRDDEAMKDEQIKRLKQKVGEFLGHRRSAGPRDPRDRRTRPRHGHPEGGGQGPPFRPGDVRRVKDVLPQMSERRICRMLEVPRPTKGRVGMTGTANVPVVDPLLTSRIEELIQVHPTYGYRRLWALLRFHDGLLVNRKAVYRILKLKGWFCHN